MAVAIAWLPGPAGTRRRVAKPSVEEPDAAEPARPDLWGARVSNDPGLPDRDSQARYARWQTAYRALKQRRPQMSDVWYASQIAKQAVAAGCQADTIRRHMTGRPGAVTRRG